MPTDLEVRKADIKSGSNQFKNFLIEMRIENEDAEITPLQALHIFSRLRNWKVTVPNDEQYGALQGKEYYVNIFDFIPVGAADIALLSFQWGTPDDMSSADHFISTEVLNSWILKLTEYFGLGA